MAWKYIVPAVLILCGAPGAWAEKEVPFQAAVQKMVETADPLEAAEQPAVKKKPDKQSKKWKKIRKEREEFVESQQERRRKFIEKVRSQDVDAEERQQRLARFHARERERAQKFGLKQQKKMREILEKERD
jgi:hypothetical protein